jgi:LacI family transcriptional regulator
MLRRSDRRTGTIGLLLEDVGNPFSAVLHQAMKDDPAAMGRTAATALFERMNGYAAEPR